MIGTGFIVSQVECIWKDIRCTSLVKESTTAPTNSAEMKYAPTEFVVTALFYVYQALVSSFISYLKSQNGTTSKMVPVLFTVSAKYLFMQHKPGTVNQVANTFPCAPVKREQVLCIEVEAAGSMIQKVRVNY